MANSHTSDNANNTDLPLQRHRNNMLYDFYGALLTERQRACFIMHHMEDCSLAEIGEEFSITPQAVSDMLKRTTRKLEKFEDKLGLVKRHESQLAAAARIREALASVAEPQKATILHALEELSYGF